MDCRAVVHSFDMPSAKTKRAHTKEWYTFQKADMCAVHKNYYVTNAGKCAKNFMQMIQKSSKMLQTSPQRGHKKLHKIDDSKKLSILKMGIGIERFSYYTSDR